MNFVFNPPPPVIMGMPTAVFFLILALVAIWSTIWKGLALWRSARNKHTAWFVVLLLVNTVGILEIIYIYFFGKISKKNKK